MFLGVTGGWIGVSSGGKGVTSVLGILLGSSVPALALTFYSSLIMGLQNAQVRDILRRVGS